ncbi:unnamed protein product [Arabidopsis halleri]
MCSRRKNRNPKTALTLAATGSRKSGSSSPAGARTTTLQQNRRQGEAGMEATGFNRRFHAADSPFRHSPPGMNNSPTSSVSGVRSRSKQSDALRFNPISVDPAFTNFTEQDLLRTGQGEANRGRF